MNGSLCKCRKRERDRERQRRKCGQGEFEASMLSFDRIASETLEDSSAGEDGSN